MTLEELRAHVLLLGGSSSLLLTVVPTDANVEEARETLATLLRETPMSVVDHGACSAEDGPDRWAEQTARRLADAHLTSFVPSSPEEGREHAILCNAQRQLLRGLGGPLLLVVSAETEQTLRGHAMDFYTWAARSLTLHELAFPG